ncbi:MULTISPECIES: chemotaxis protein CheB [unclassified Mesorhizobium]|uniref:chemotaxis protein CheB n=1 Tax=unclassified Mesorhizobium TaxID=325217 RepID=UPI00112AD35A|nr:MULTISPECIES: chemotaxis protein CheB [unclassified Mesorhizobium]MBZ9739712.1 chemotaxis protein CheB [Mesorhizobium sp. CO1-1-4]MBZ9805024.1 chemotaxis protein CheB [Mesorhizobium sp. ES1-6]TPL83520.1 chemotaxis protein CheB [Mesorhizobium sp. B2-3-12]
MHTPHAKQEGGPFFVAIGASGSDGLSDIKDLLSGLPKGLKAIVLVVLHRPSDKVSHLSDILGKRSKMPVVIADEDDVFRVGCCYIGQPDAHLSLAARSNVALVEGSGHIHRGQTVDILFNSVAVHAKTRAIGIVLSGSLSDGSRGLAAISHAGGATMVLTEAGKIKAGMPMNAALYDGPLDFAGSADQIADEVIRRVQRVQPQPSLV